MSEQTIKCPNCGTEFEASTVLTESIRSQLRTELEADLVKKQEDLKKRLDEAREKERALVEREEALEDAVLARLDEERKKVAATERKRVEQELKVEMEDLQEQLAERTSKLEEATKREAALRRLQRQIEEKEQGLELQLQERLDEERAQIAEKAKKQAEETFTRKARETEETLAGLQEQLAEREKKLEAAHQMEVECLRKEREIQEKERTLNLELERRLTEAQGKLHEQATKEAQDAQALKMREKDDLIDRLKEQMQQLQRRMEQGSQESQGEALEGELEDKLRAAFPFDRFEEVKKGAHGADIIQTVCDDRRRVCGKILWEAKNARNFQVSWIEKLKKDQLDAGASLSVLTTVAMPAQIEQFGQLEDGPLWIAGYGCAIALCAALRQQLMCVAREKLMVEHRDTVKDVLFDYVTGSDFSQRVKAIVDTYATMHADLESEKRSIKRIWKKREKQIDKVLGNIVEMRGELDGLVGPKALPEHETLTLDHIAPEGEYDDEEPEDAADEDEYDEAADNGTEYDEDEDGDDDDPEEEDDAKPATRQQAEPEDDSQKWWVKKRGIPQRKR